MFHQHEEQANESVVRHSDCCGRYCIQHVREVLNSSGTEVEAWAAMQRYASDDAFVVVGKSGNVNGVIASEASLEWVWRML